MDVHVPDGVDAAPVVLWVHGGVGHRGPTTHTVAMGPAAAVRAPPRRRVRRRDARLPPHPRVRPPLRPCTISSPRSVICAAMPGSCASIPDRVGAWGESAGAHLVALAGLAGSAPTPDSAARRCRRRDGRTDVRAIVYWYGASDLTALPDLHTFFWPKGRPAEGADLALRCSPRRARSCRLPAAAGRMATPTRSPCSTRPSVWRRQPSPLARRASWWSSRRRACLARRPCRTHWDQAIAFLGRHLAEAPASNAA